MKSRFDWRVAFWVLFIGLLVADQALKHWVRLSFVEHQSRPIIPNILELTLTYNRGIAFGMFQGLGPMLAPVAIAIAVGAGLYSIRHPKESPSIHVAMALLASGALGNLYDRVFLGQVTDMFQVRAFNFPIFNVADSCITIAAAILIIRWGGEWFTGQGEHGAAKAEGPSGGEPTEFSASPASAE